MCCTLTPPKARTPRRRRQPSSICASGPSARSVLKRTKVESETPFASLNCAKLAPTLTYQNIAFGACHSENGPK
jgi:hypothetical protein